MLVRPRRKRPALPTDPATAYAIAVDKGQIVAGPHVRAACKRHLADLKRLTALGYTWNQIDPKDKLKMPPVERVIDFFKTVLTVEIEESDGVSKAVPFILQPWQCFIVGSLFGWKNDKGLRRFRRAYIELAKGNGKALALDTPIPTPHGWKTMQDMRVGDQVFDELGDPCNVTFVTGAMKDHKCYELEFDDGSKIVADAEHLWLTEQRRYDRIVGKKCGPIKGTKKSEWGSWRLGLRTTEEIAKTLRYKNGIYNSCNHSVSLAGPLQLPDVDLLIPPYTLGVWLGDGDSDGARLTVAFDDFQIVRDVESEGVCWNAKKEKRNPNVARVSLSDPDQETLVGIDVLARALVVDTFTTSGIAADIGRDEERVRKFVVESPYFELISPAAQIKPGSDGRLRGLVPARWAIAKKFRKKATRTANSPESMRARLRRLKLLGNKHIPKQYLRASFEQRLSLLQGLMDTDGYIDKIGNCVFTSTKKALVNDTFELICSLGIKAAIQEKQAKLYGQIIGPVWNIQFNPPYDLKIFRLERKLARHIKRTERRRLSQDRRIVKCRRVKSVPVKCIGVDSPSHLYLASRSMIPTHNSPTAAAIGHYMLVATDKIRGEVYSAATDRDQAAILFRDAVAMWERSPELHQQLTPFGDKAIWQLSDRRTDSFFRPISSEKRGKSGIRPYCALLDEIHEHPDDSVIEMLRAGTKMNQQALIFEITNAGFDRESVCWKEHEYTVEVVNGIKENEAWFGFIASLDDDDDPFEDESCWIKANPNLGVSIQLPYIREQVTEAKGMPSKEALVRRLNFCTWTDAAKTWITKQLWEKIEAPFDIEEYAGQPCSLGLDMSFTQDLTALAYVFPTGDDTFDAFIDYWKPKEKLADHAKLDGIDYSLYHKKGFLFATEGPVIKLEHVAARIGWAMDKFDVTAIAYDRYRHREMAQELSDLGIDAPLIEHPQGFRRGPALSLDSPVLVDQYDDKKPENPLWMPGSFEKLETAIIEKRLRIAINPLTRWNVSCVAIRDDPAGTGNRVFDKKKCYGRIDGIVALAMALGAASIPKAPPRKSVYELLAERNGTREPIQEDEKVIDYMTKPVDDSIYAEVRRRWERAEDLDD